MPYTEKINDAFSAFDKDGDGVISSPEFVIILRSLGVVLLQDDVIKIEKQFTTLTRENCIKEVQNFIQSKDIEADLKQKVKSFDRGGKGSLNILEISQVLKNMSDVLNEKDVEELSKQLDPSKSGEVKVSALMEYIMS